MMKIRLRSVVALCLGLALAGCGSAARRGAEEEVRRNLKDPDSAKFGKFYFNEKTERACLAVNAKNALGGYTGEHHALLVTDNKVWAVASMEAQNAEHCRRAADSAE
jgi:hypothetical protein